MIVSLKLSKKFFSSAEGLEDKELISPNEKLVFESLGIRKDCKKWGEKAIGAFSICLRDHTKCIIWI